MATDLWVVENGEPRLVRLGYVPDSGLYHRFAVDAGNFQWDEDLVVRHGRDTIRFINGKVWGPWSDGIRRESGASHRDYRVTIGIMEGAMQGRFVEVVTSGANPADARTRAQALLGYVSLILGPGRKSTRVGGANNRTRCLPTID